MLLAVVPLPEILARTAPKELLLIYQGNNKIPISRGCGKMILYLFVLNTN